MKAKAFQGEFSKNSLSELIPLSRAGITPTLSSTLMMKKKPQFIVQNGRILSKNRAINLDSKEFT